jgi:hypothetical protein
LCFKCFFNARMMTSQKSNDGSASGTRVENLPAFPKKSS